MATALLLAGLLAGGLAGLLGIGGGIVTTPCLLAVFLIAGTDPGVIMQCALGTSLAAMLPTALASARAHRARDAISPELLRRWAPAAALGAALGGILGHFLPMAALAGIFGLLALAVAARLAGLAEIGRAARALPRPALQRLIAGLVGTLSALMGIGGGSFNVPTLTAFGLPVHKAIGNAAALGLAIALPGALGFALSGLGMPGRPPLSVGYVNLPAIALISPASWLAAPWGARLAHATRPRRLRRIFALLLAVVALLLLREAWRGLAG